MACVRAALAAGGCTASRASLVGACVAARTGGGGRAVPAAWLERAHAGPEALRLAAAAVAARPGGAAVALEALTLAKAAEQAAFGREFGMTYELHGGFAADAEK